MKKRRKAKVHIFVILPHVVQRMNYQRIWTIQIQIIQIFQIYQIIKLQNLIIHIIFYQPHHYQLHHPCYQNYKNRRNSIINQRLAEISGIYSVQEVNQMEREFLKYLGHHNNWVSDKDIREFVENNKYALGIC
jgi:hypothetical protein